MLNKKKPFSPLLLILFVNDRKESLYLALMTKSDINLLSDFMLMFAEDIAHFNNLISNISKIPKMDILLNWI